MFAKGGMDMDFHYLNFLFVSIVGMILIYDFYKINFFKKILFLFIVSLFAFISGIYLVQEIFENIYLLRGSVRLGLGLSMNRNMMILKQDTNCLRKISNQTIP